MRQGLIRVLRPHGAAGEVRPKWVRPDGIKSPSQAAAHRRRYVESLRSRLIKLLGGKCVRCGYDQDIRALQIDHIRSDGKLDRAHKGGSYYHHILNTLDRERHQVLCANCNAIMRIERQECPRKEE